MDFDTTIGNISYRQPYAQMCIADVMPMGVYYIDLLKFWQGFCDSLAFPKISMSPITCES